MKCPFTSLLPNLDIICFISMMMLTIKRKQKNDRIVRHDFICLLNAEVFSALWINSTKKTVLLKMQLGAFLCERKNNVDVYCPAIYCFTIGFKLPTIMKWEMLLLKVIFSQSRNVKRLKYANSCGDRLTCMTWWYWKLFPKCYYFQGQGSRSSIPIIIILPQK